MNGSGDMIGFSILNYNTFDDTQKCIESIEKYCEKDSYFIVIVDNASPDGSGDRLDKAYADRKEVTVIMNANNAGFACGNNIGFRYLKDKGCDYIVVVNSDVELLEGFSVSKIKDYYHKYGFAVLGPQIITESYDSGKVNPVRMKPMTTWDIKKLYFKLFVRLLIYKTGLSFLNKYDGNKRRLNRSSINYDKVATDCELHGCCWIFSREFINLRDGLNESTFMYGEEDILFYELLLSGLVSLYVPDICVLHKGKRATKMTFDDYKRMKVFEISNRIKSLRCVLNVSQEYWKQVKKQRKKDE